MTLDQLMETAKPETDRAEAIGLLKEAVQYLDPGYTSHALLEARINAFLARVGQ